MSLSGSSIALRFTAAICLAIQAQGMHLSGDVGVRQHFDQGKRIRDESDGASIIGISPPSKGWGFGRFVDVCLPRKIAPVRADSPQTRSILGIFQTASWAPISPERPNSPAGHHTDIVTASAAKVPEE